MTRPEFGTKALEVLKGLAEQKDIDICAYLAKNGIDVETNLHRLFDIMNDAERPEDRKEAAKKLFELDFRPEQMAKWGRQSYFRLGVDIKPDATEEVGQHDKASTTSDA